MRRPIVMVIEDDPDIGSSLIEVLEFIDVDARLISDGTAAFAAIEETRPDLVLMDIHLPGKSGLDILSELRADPQLTDMKVVLVTADGFLTPAATSKADAVLLKPYSIGELNDVVLRMLPA
jgi:two-component system, OmpR family, phosphate regulon response regulator PhoB